MRVATAIACAALALAGCGDKARRAPPREAGRPPTVEARIRPPPPDPELHQAVEKVVTEEDPTRQPWVFQWPLREIDISSPYGIRMHPVVHRLLFHAGIDFNLGRGEPVLSVGPGHVVTAETLPLTGKTVIIQHPGHLATLYAHLDEILVFPGEGVQGGAAVGLIGSTGRSTGPHLHFTVYRVEGKDRLPVDPTPLIGAVIDPRRPPMPWPAEIVREKGAAPAARPAAAGRPVAPVQP
jgi:murein DD-endopeptidase MepM/ murein hydrolase activator NlpD